MADHLYRESPREEYFYQLGRLEAFKEAGAHAVVKAYEAVVSNARAQIQ